MPKDACRTYWIQQIDTYAVFLELLLAVHMTLLAITSPNQYQNLGDNWSWDRDTATKANNGLLFQLESSAFLAT